MIQQKPRTALVVHPSAEMYGSDRQCLESVHGLLAERWRVVVALPHEGPMADAARAAGAEVRFVASPVLRKSLLSPRGLLALVRGSAAALPGMVRAVRSTDPDVVYVSTLTAPLWPAVAALLRRPLLVHVHEAEDSVPAPLRAALAAPLLLAGRVLVNSAASEQVLRSSLPGATRRSRVLHNGVPGPPDPSPAREDLAGSSGAPHLALVGRLSPRKGTDVAVAAAGELHRRGLPVTLDLVGSVFPGYEWFEQELRASIEELGLAGSVVLRGWADSPWPAMRDADVVLVPSRVEPFGNTAVEAMLSGRPVVASRTQGLVEVVRDGVDGVLVRPGDPAALADAVQALAADWPAATARARAARTAAGKRFSVGAYRSAIAAEVAALAR